MTRKAAEEFLKGWADIIVRMVKKGEEVSLTFNSTFHIAIESHGRCGLLEESRLLLKAEGNYIRAIYEEGHSDPCSKFYIADYSVDNGEIRIELERVSTSLICIQCIGVITANISIGPLPPGNYKVHINGICESVSISKY